MNKHANQKIELVLIKTAPCVALSVAWLPDAISWGMLESRVSDISDASAKAFSHRLFDADLQIYMPAKAPMTVSQMEFLYDRQNEV